MRALAFAVTTSLAFAQSPSQIRAIAEKAYTYAYPMVLMEYTRRAAAERGGLGGPVGAISSPTRSLSPTHAFVK